MFATQLEPKIAAARLFSSRSSSALTCKPQVVTGASASTRPLLETELRSGFAFFDKDGSGSVSPVELESGIALLDYQGASGAALRELTAAAPGNGPPDVDLTFGDYCRAFAYYISGADNLGTPMQLRIAFDLFDCDGDGVLTIEEFRSALARMAPAPVEELAVQRIVRELDIDGDGAISIEEWIEFCRRRYIVSIIPTRDGHGGITTDLLPPLK